MRTVDEDHARIDHPVIERLVENMFKNFADHFIREALAESIAHCRKVRNIIQQPIPQKPPICYIHLNFPVGLPQRGDPKQMLNEYHLDKHNRICAGSVVMAVVRVYPLIQPLIVHNFLYFAQQVILGYQCIYIHHYDVFP